MARIQVVLGLRNVRVGSPCELGFATDKVRSSFYPAATFAFALIEGHVGVITVTDSNREHKSQDC